jgi:hypothetical protein
MKKFLILLILSVFPLYFLTISGCESTSGPANGEGVIRGSIFDSTSVIPLDSVIVTTTPSTSTVMTNSSGGYIITGVSDGTYTITAKKPGYFTRTTTATVLDADTATANTRMQFTGLYIYNNITVQETNTGYTNLSAVDLFRGIAINEVQLNDPNKDIQMRNSYDTLGNSIDFYLRSGDLAFQRAGSQTFFGQPLSNTYTKAQFDTISVIPGFDGNYSAFFSQNATATFNVFPEGSNNVYPFWLSGRGNNPNIIGIIYLRKSYIGVGNLFNLDIDVKVNRLGYNIFNGNQ